MDEVKWKKQASLKQTLVIHQAMSNKCLAPPAKMVFGQEEIEDLVKKRKIAEASDEMLKYAYTPSVKEKCELMFTELEGKQIACFDIGGETRLCLIQVLQNVLIGLKLNEITPIFEELKVFLPYCTSEQLNSLKEKFIIPRSTRECGLITKSDAQRLCSFLRNKQADERSWEPSEAYQSHHFRCTFKVVHNCFGGCEGIFIRELFHSSSQKCIECLQCHQIFSPRYFVSHVHAFFENKQTCHWGFDSNNWTHYLFVHPSEPEEKEAILNQIKKQYSHVDQRSLPFPPPIDIHNLPYVTTEPPLESPPAILEERNHSNSDFPPNVSLVVSKDSTTLPFNYHPHEVVNKYTEEEEVMSDDDDDEDETSHLQDDDDVNGDEKEFERLNILARNMTLEPRVYDVIEDYQRLCRRLMDRKNCGDNMEKHPPNKTVPQSTSHPPNHPRTHLPTNAHLHTIQLSGDPMPHKVRFQDSLSHNHAQTTDVNNNTTTIINTASTDNNTTINNNNTNDTNTTLNNNNTNINNNDTNINNNNLTINNTNDSTNNNTNDSNTRLSNTIITIPKKRKRCNTYVS